MIFDVGTRRRSNCIAGCGCVNDSDDTRQYSLRERGSEDPATDKSRNASTHPFVS
jgi:hypothetical protein